MRPLPGSLELALRRGGEGLTLLVVRMSAMGDLLRTLPAVRLVRRALPAARLHWLVDDRWSVVLDRHPDLDGLVPFPRRSRGAGPHLALRRRLRELRADLVLDFHGNLRSGLAGWASGAPVRLGYSGHQQREGNRWFNTHHQPSGGRRMPRLERNLDLVRALGLPDHPLPAGDLPLVAAGRESATTIIREWLKAPPAFAVIAPGASQAQAHKRPPTALLSAASRLLARRGIRALVVWGPGEESDAHGVASDPQSGAILAPPTDLPALAALLERARLFVGGDSGPLHLACAVGCPVLGIYGPTDPEVNRPWGVPYRTVHPEGRTYSGIRRVDRRAGGFEGLLPRHVESAVGELLKETEAWARAP